MNSLFNEIRWKKLKKNCKQKLKNFSEFENEFDVVIPDERFPGLESDDADSDLSGFDPILPPPELSELPQIPHIPQNLADENADAHRENGLDNGYNPWQTFLKNLIF